MTKSYYNVNKLNVFVGIDSKGRAGSIGLVPWILKLKIED